MFVVAASVTLVMFLLISSVILLKYGVIVVEMYEVSDAVGVVERV